MTRNQRNDREISPEIQQAKQRFSIIGNAPALLIAIERAIKVAPIDLSVLVMGESGSGKEFFPKIIHQYGARKHRKYIAVNCGAIPEGTIDSELFGHEKGSFTGAVATRKGYFEEADGGTIFLDEVAELPLTTQARLLRVLETGEFMKVGSSSVQKTDIRIVAATNVDLMDAIKKGKFREDLYYRLSTVRIDVPNLHDRGDDIFLLARKFASDFSERYLTAPITFSEGARHSMELYRWPGNVRQLKNVVEQLALFNAGTEISRDDMLDILPIGTDPMSTPVRIEHKPDYEAEREMIWQLLLSLKAELQQLKAEMGADDRRAACDVPRKQNMTSIIKYGFDDISDIPSVGASKGVSLEDSEKEAVIAALARNNGKKKPAADELGISLRTLYRKIREFGIDDSESAG